MAPPKKNRRTIPGTNIPIGGSKRKSNVTQKQREEQRKAIEKYKREQELAKNPEKALPKAKQREIQAQKIYPGINDKVGKTSGNANPYTQPRKGTEVREIFEKWGFKYWSDVLADPKDWRSSNRNPKNVRHTGYTSIAGAIKAADEGNILHMARLYRDERGLWHLYIIYGDEDE